MYIIFYHLDLSDVWRNKVAALSGLKTYSRYIKLLILFLEQKSKHFIVVETSFVLNYNIKIK